jgi:hypothetical protein
MRGPSHFDHKHRFVLSYVWEIPKMPAASGIVRTLLHGWQATGIGQYQTGRPFTIVSGRDNSRTGLESDRAQVTGVSWKRPAGADKRVWFNPAAFAVNDVGTFGNSGKNSLYGPPLYSWDMGIFKNFRITERVNTQFRAEFFNIFNQTNFDAPTTSGGNNNTNVTAGGFGRVTRTLPGDAGEPRILQFGLKVVF